MIDLGFRYEIHYNIDCNVFDIYYGNCWEGSMDTYEAAREFANSLRKNHKAPLNYAGERNEE